MISELCQGGYSLRVRNALDDRLNKLVKCEEIEVFLVVEGVDVLIKLGFHFLVSVHCSNYNLITNSQ